MIATARPTEQHSDDILERLAGKQLVVYAGTLEPYQGIDRVIRGFRYVISAIPDAALLIVGGTQAQVDEYRQLADQCGVGMACHFTGRVPQAQAKHYANHATVQISSRVSGTNTPLKVYEQLSRGVPIVATNIYSHTQVLDDSVAFLVEPTPDDMAQGILRALQHPEEAQQKARNAQELYETRYSRRVYTEKMKRLFNQLGFPTVEAQGDGSGVSQSLNANN
jgi:glycosyltransferase involved in cell wall biosynthesis